MDVPDEVREYLDDLHERAVAEGLDPEWHDDRLGFSMLCPGCKDTPDEHRADLRPFDPIVIPVMVIPMQRMPRTPNDNATGPAA